MNEFQERTLKALRKELVFLLEVVQVMEDTW